MNEKFFFDGEFVEGTKFWTHASSALFLEYHDHMRRIGAGTRMDNTLLRAILEQFSQFHSSGKGMMIRENIGRKTTWY
jgi:hypothetical protein